MTVQWLHFCCCWCGCFQFSYKTNVYTSEPRLQRHMLCLYFGATPFTMPHVMFILLGYPIYNATCYVYTSGLPHLQCHMLRLYFWATPFTMPHVTFILRGYPIYNATCYVYTSGLPHLQCHMLRLYFWATPFTMPHVTFILLGYPIYNATCYVYTSGLPHLQCHMLRLYFWATPFTMPHVTFILLGYPIYNTTCYVYTSGLPHLQCHMLRSTYRDQQRWQHWWDWPVHQWKSQRQTWGEHWPVGHWVTLQHQHTGQRTTVRHVSKLRTCESARCSLKLLWCTYQVSLSPVIIWEYLGMSNVRTSDCWLRIRNWVCFETLVISLTPLWQAFR